MTNSDFTSVIEVAQSADEVYNAVNNVRGWWQGEITGSTDNLNVEFKYRKKDAHDARQRVTEVIRGNRIVWLVTDSKLISFKDPSEWTGTKIIFEITEKNNKTQLRFTHTALVPAF